MEAKKSNELEYEVEFKRLRAGKSQPYGCYILYGDDRGNMQTFLNGLIDMMVPKEEQEFAVSRHDMRQVAVQEALMDAETAPFMVERKVVIVDYSMFFTAVDKKVDPKTGGGVSSAEAGDEEGDGEEAKNGRNTWTKAEHDLQMLADYLQNPVDFSVTVFLVTGQKLDERKKLVTMLRKLDDRLLKSKLLAFEPMKGERLHAWLLKLVQRRGLKFADGAFEHFLDLNGENQMMLRSELDKLALHVQPGEVITDELIEKLGIRSFEQSVFKLMEYVSQRKLASAHEMLHELYKYPKENSPFLILNLVARQFRTMLIVKQMDRQQKSNSEIAGVIGVAPYAIKKIAEQARRWEMEQLMAVLAECAELDYKFKSGQVLQELALELLVLRLAS